MLDWKRYPLSHAQKRVWYTEKLHPGTSIYTVPATLRLTQTDRDIDYSRMEETYRHFMVQTPSLRIRIAERGEDEPEQYAVPFNGAPLTVLDGARLDIEMWLREQSRKPLYAEHADLCAFTLIKLTDRECMVFMRMHHLLCDGYTLDLMARRWIELYQALMEGREIIEGGGASYSHFLDAEADYERSDKFQQDRKFWLAECSDLPQVPYYCPSSASTTSARFTRLLSSERSDAIFTFCSDNGITPYSMFISLLFLLQSKLWRTNDLVLGTPYANRMRDEEKSIIGMLVSTIPFRMTLDRQMPIVAFMQSVDDKKKNIAKHQQYPFNLLYQEVRGLTANHDPMFRVSMEYRASGLYQTDHIKYELLHIFPDEEENELVVRVNHHRDKNRLCMEVDYKTELFTKSDIERLHDQLLFLVDQTLNNPDMLLEAMSICLPQDEAQIAGFHGTSAASVQPATLHGLFEKQAALTPEYEAIICGDERWTYRRLNDTANQLAWTLKKHYAMAPDRSAAVLMNRSPLMIATLLAVMKAGGCYVPIDPDYPDEHIRFILRECEPQVLLTDTANVGSITEGFPTCLQVEEASAYDRDASEPPQLAAPGHLAYIIYTSGSTGQPKGVMIEHGSICNALTWRVKEYALSPDARALQLFSYAFDGFVASLWTPLLSGAAAVVLRQDAAKDVLSIRESIRAEHITHLITTPSLYNALLEDCTPDDMATLQVVTLAGEKLASSLVAKSKQLYPSLELTNEYGPTENSVVSTFYRHLKADDLLPIGKPITNVIVRILDQDGQRLPMGAVGEVALEGPGLARGYQARRDLTEEKFVPSPFRRGERMYKTGDLARWLPDGNLEYIGREDDQVKIRGYRIELQAIQSRLLDIAEIQEAIVTAPEAGGQRQLCAYVRLTEPIGEQAIRSRLAESLPSYMLPAFILILDQFPLSPNGKIALKQLPAPSKDSQESGRIYREPVTEVEKHLARIWSEVLGVEGIGVEHHFFEWGGDSIKGMQIASRLHRAGYKLEMKDMLQYPTIAAAASYVKPVAAWADQRPVVGEVPLSPIQRWFFEKRFHDIHHWNQSFMFASKEALEPELARSVLKKLAEHHDSLRMVYPDSGAYDGRQVSRSPDSEAFELTVMDLRGRRDFSAWIEQGADRLQRSLSLAQGPLVHAAIFQTDEGDHLLLVVHHLIMDGVSWRILIEDFIEGYEQALQGKPLELPAKTLSFQQWASWLQDYAYSSELHRELPYWEEIARGCREERPLIQPLRDDWQKDACRLEVRLSEEDTGLLLRGANQAYRTEAVELVLSALGLALRAWKGIRERIVLMEGHGREYIGRHADVSRTVGWFTSIYPIRLEAYAMDDVSGQIRATKEMLRSVPNKGVGYSALRYLAKEQAVRSSLAAQPTIGFNYLGQFDQEFRSDRFQPSSYSTGTAIGGDNRRTEPIEVIGMVVDQRLKFEIGYNRKLHDVEDMERLAESFHSMLKQVLHHCLGLEESVHTPSDFSAIGLTSRDMEQAFLMLEQGGIFK
ncbi:non-ribosomal peptide synthetase [Paenibacillus paeoniae]|nr:non-ribosomal peptide synthetase [Paenibacillus paeoniae]